LEQVKADQGNGRSKDKSENLLNKEVKAALAQGKVRNGAVKTKNGKKK